MFTKILGIIWMAGGVFFFIKPQILKNWLKKKSYKKMRKLLFLVIFLLGIHFIGIATKFGGLPSMIILILGIIAIIKGFLFLKLQAKDKLAEFYANLPLKLLRFFSLVGIIFGAFLFFIK